MNLFAGQEQNADVGNPREEVGEVGWDEPGNWDWQRYTAVCRTDGCGKLLYGTGGLAWCLVLV